MWTKFLFEDSDRFAKNYVIVTSCTAVLDSKPVLQEKLPALTHRVLKIKENDAYKTCSLNKATKLLFQIFDLFGNCPQKFENTII